MRLSPGALRTTAELGFERGNARLQRLVLLARQARHVLDRLELLTLDDVKIAQDLLGLIAHHGIDFALDALGGPSRVVHQTPDLVEKSIAGLGHPSPLQSACTVCQRQWRSIAIHSRPYRL